MLIIKGKYLISSSEDIYIDHSLIVEGENVIDILSNSEAEKKVS